jgi:hypothetical protein
MKIMQSTVVASPVHPSSPIPEKTILMKVDKTLNNDCCIGFVLLRMMRLAKKKTMRAWQIRSNVTKTQEKRQCPNALQQHLQESTKNRNTSCDLAEAV